MDPYNIIIKPQLTEKSMNAIDYKNELTFVVRRTAKKPEIKEAFQQLFEVKVERVNTQINSRGEKIAYLKLAEEHSAEDIAVKMGVF
ncbi:MULTISPECIES: 50S ribosomal protein L23 [Methanobacterium]|jgi:large subunit ribosomal protein L23|uniref:Large ribosomal subunit protein uL23 n=1 Tax=Methanobacterium formicicum TaxID=2162 RepID=A0A089ZB18_METFO|nr:MULTISPECIES: 50S ribosomal protein L23 [Methanobacterium]AIS31232.1 ribosomal protein L23P Rpl23p [Methanobacterium formicicum]AXV38836.1 MAG: 50S ribosomal protein L23 [Methanobacterium sp. BAmetb5]KUK75502.1 MAG: 50S ribosomal protein L23P [Methanobacterium sp. 42_16]MBF4474429.1 50S ribosomal protein L23 [Methanobacterium formicicum]MDD4810332.1 50S ribosomal protein L23 [Methanobacterium formicicum]